MTIRLISQVYVGQWLTFYGPAILLHVLKTIYSRKVVLGMIVLLRDWPCKLYVGQLPIFHGPLILPYIIVIDFKIFYDKEMYCFQPMFKFTTVWIYWSFDLFLPLLQTKIKVIGSFALLIFLSLLLKLFILHLTTGWMQIRWQLLVLGSLHWLWALVNWSSSKW